MFTFGLASCLDAITSIQKRIILASSLEYRFADYGIASFVFSDEYLRLAVAILRAHKFRSFSVLPYRCAMLHTLVFTGVRNNPTSSAVKKVLTTPTKE